MNTSVNPILCIAGYVTAIGNVKQVNKSTIRQSFVLEIHTQFGVEVLKFYAENDLCNELPYFTGNPKVHIYFRIAGKMSKTGTVTNHFRIISIIKQ